MKKSIIKIISFLYIFVTIFFGVQNTLVMFDHGKKDLQETYKIYNDNNNKIDVCYIGSSPVYVGISPMVVYGENGITSINFGMDRQTALLSYFQVYSLLNMHKPKLVVVDLCSLFDLRTADNGYEENYRKMVIVQLCMKMKYELLKMIIDDNENQNIFDYCFPLFYYHNNWTFFYENFTDYKSYPCYFRGGLLKKTKFSKTVFPDGYMTKMSDGNINLNSLSYYVKLFKLCHDSGIKILAINMPKNKISWTDKRIESCKKICNKYNVTFVDFNSKSELNNINLVQERDYYDEGHMNAKGCFKFSIVLSNKLKKLYDLEDHRNDPEYSDWNKDYASFYEDYKDVFQSLEERPDSKDMKK